MKRIRQKLKRIRSMHLSLFLLLLLVSFAVLAGVTAGILFIYKEQAIEDRFSEVSDYGMILSNQMAAAGYLAGNGTTEINTELSVAADIFEGRIIVVDGNLKVVTDTYNYEVGKTLISREVVQCIRGGGVKYANQEGGYVELLVPITQGDTKQNVGVVILRASLKKEINTFSKVKNWFFTLDAVLLCLVALVAFFASGRMVKPFKEIISSIRHVTDGHLEDMVSIRGFTEVERISDSFNEMLKQMKKVEDSRQDFVSNVSHELKTPMTSIKVLADSLMMQEDVPVDLYREFLVDITDEIERENKIINDLLSLVSLNQKSSGMHIAKVDINELLEIILKRVKPIAQKRSIELIFESFRPVVAEVDEVKLSLGVSNLIENAVKYNVDEGTVRVSLNADHKFFYITVADSGIGIPESAQPFIFDRFYRVDKARSRETGGTGLGLAITKSVVLRHKGSIKVYSRENEGTTFTVRIPLSYIV